MDKITKKQAKEINSKFYYTGIECSNGHIAERYVSSGKCAVCERNKANKNREENKEKLKAQQKKWREENKEKLKESKRQYRISNKEKLKEKDAKYYRENKDKIRIAQQEYVDRNKETIREYQKKWKQENDDHVRAERIKYKNANRNKLNEEAKEYYHTNKDEILLKNKERYQQNREEILKYANEYRYKNKDVINAKGREYRKRPHVKKRKRERDKYLRQHCPRFKIMAKCRELLHRTLGKLDESKTDGTYTLLGYDHEALRAHMERYMIDGMTWENFGSYWCLDHRYSVSRMIDDGVTDPSIVNHLKNLRPLLVEHNLSKWTKTEGEYFTLNPDIKLLYPEMPEFNY